MVILIVFYYHEAEEGKIYDGNNYDFNKEIRSFNRKGSLEEGNFRSKSLMVIGRKRSLSGGFGSNRNIGKETENSLKSM